MTKLQSCHGRGRALCIAATCAVGAMLTAGIATGDADADQSTRLVHFQNENVVVRKQAAAQLADTLAVLGADVDQRHVMLSFDGPLSRSQRNALSNAGVELGAYVGGDSYFAALDKVNFDAEAVATIGVVDSATSIEPEWKLHRDYANDVVQPWTVVEEDFVAAYRAVQDLRAQGKETADPAIPVNPTVVAYVVFHPDVETVPDGVMTLAPYGGVMRSQLKSINALVAEIPYDQIRALAAEDSVQYIEPALPKFSVVNAENRPRVGADIVQAAPYGLDGSGVNVMVYDGGTIFAHGDFGSRFTIGDSDGISDHATHVSGTIGGDGSGSGGMHMGMAPGVHILSYGFETGGPLEPGFLYTDPGDIEADYGDAINTHGADIANNSIGTNTAPNGFPCEWTGDYGVTSAVIDGVVRGSLGSDMRIVWANGNERQTSRCGSLYNTTAPPACAKNHITVGALNSEDDSNTSFTSWGPTDDGRIKPDISAPGCQDNGDGGVTSTSSSGGYNVKCGTSMASPTVTGVGALMLQAYRQSFPSEPDPRNATMKAILANTAVDVGNPGPDFQNGYGSVRAPAAVDLINAGNFVEDEISQGEIYSLIVIANPGDTELRVTLAWDDVPGTPNVIPSLINDLDLRVFDPNNNRVFPWTLDPANPDLNAVQTTEDHLNNIEQVTVTNPMPGGYRVEIFGFNVPSGPQTFSVAANPLLIDCAPAGIASMNKSNYACESVATLRVVDCDLNTDDGVVDTVSVLVTSDTEPGGETILLTEVSAEASAFTADLTLSQTNSAGTLHVSPGDTVTLTYIDADDGDGGTNVPVLSASTIDCSAPSLVSVQTIDVEPRSATVEVEFSENASVTVHYGTTCGAPTESKSVASLDTMHDIAIADLVDDTTYFYELEFADEAGNMSTDDNGGLCYSFTTPEIPDLFSEQINGEFDLDGLSITYIPNATIDGYSACTQLISVLPIDPAGGSTLPLSDDDSEIVSVGGGDEVVFYETNWSEFYVGSNGYITFGSGDSDYTESFADHFDLPRISMLFDDLNPAAGGSVSWKQLADQIVVTWDDVAEYSTSNSNTFQVSLFFDGRIRTSWLGIDSTDAIVGLSEGGGLSPDFFSTDLSGKPSCGPQPPNSVNVTAETGAGTPVDIALLGGDDGLPDPPAALSYIITSLPAGTLLDSSDNHVITPGDLPYTLIAFGNTVTYQPGFAFSGVDSFNYLVDDGGTPPEGGQSSEATVSVTVGTASLAYSFPFDTDPGWSMEGDWGFGQPTGGGTHAGDPSGGFTGSNVYGYNLNGDYPNNMSSTLYLTSTAIDCSSLVDTELRFQRWLGVESSTYDHANIEISTDGSTWTEVWDHSGGSISESSWSEQTYDISSIADGEATVYLRWGMGTTDGSVTYPGWNIDDVQIWAVQPVEIPGDINNDGFVDTFDLLALLEAWGPCPGCDADINGDNVVDTLDLLVLLENWTGSGGLQIDEGMIASPQLADRRPVANADTETTAVTTLEVFVNDGLLEPVVHGGTFVAPGAYRQTAVGELSMEIAGRQPVTEVDLLSVANTARLDGILSIWIGDKFELKAGDRFTLVVADRIEGEFAELQLPVVDGLRLEVVYSTTRVELVVVANGEAPVAANEVDVRRVLSILDRWQVENAVRDLQAIFDATP